MKRSKGIIRFILLACTFILCFNARAFKKDSQVIGTWVSIDFVSNIADFKPATKSWKGDLYLKKFEFHQGGSTHKPFWTWTKGHVYHAGDQSDAEYTIQKINDEDYLFLEWMSGDVLIRNQKPKYYVLKRQ